MQVVAGLPDAPDKIDEEEALGTIEQFLRGKNTISQDWIVYQLGKLNWRNSQRHGAKIGYDNGAGARSANLGTSYTISCDMDAGAF